MNVGGEKEEKKWEEDSYFDKCSVSPHSLDSGRHTYLCIIQRTPIQLDGDATKSKNTRKLFQANQTIFGGL